jgi:hypothetical protein
MELYRGGQFYWRMKLEYPEKTIDLPEVIDKLHHQEKNIKFLKSNIRGMKR